MKSIYRQLNKALVEAIQEGEIDLFIERLNKTLQAYPSNYMAWLFISRAYVAKGDVENAANSYSHLLRIADPYNPNNERLLDEVQKFVVRYKRLELVEVAEERFGSGCLKLPQQLREQISKAQPPTAEGPTEIQPSRSAKQPVQTTPSPDSTGADTTALNTRIRSILAKANKAFQKGNLETALENFKQAYDRSARMFLMLAQTLQRLQRYDEAQKYLDLGIQVLKGKRQLALLNLKAQIFSSQRQWDKAASVYERVIRQEKRSAARRSSRLQLARIYYRLEAKSVLDQVMTEYPEDQVALRLRAALDQPLVAEPSDIEGLDDDEAIRGLEVDLPDEGVSLISPMLQRDLAAAEYRDDKILLQGGRPQVDDADRLLEQAEKTKGSEFGERYPLFLEAAKAYNELPEGSYELERFHWALTRYGMLKGGAIVSEFRRKILSGQATAAELLHLRDSATSYYLESLALQVRVDPRYTLIPLTNHLRVQVAYALYKRGDSIPTDLFQRKFDDLFSFCIHHPDDEIARIAYETVIACGAAGARIWSQWRKLGRAVSLLWASLDREEARRRPYRILSAMSGQSFEMNQKPGEVLKAAFLERRRQTQEILDFFVHLQQIPLDIQNLHKLDMRWKQFPIYRGALLNTDLEIHDGVSAILATMLPYQSRSPEERTAILFTARTNIENLLRFIQENPTYWGRVGFEPLLTRWQLAIHSIEQRRLSEIQPKLVARLEPPIFRPEGEHIEGGISLQNIGRGTAESIAMHIQLCTYDTGDILCEREDVIREELGVNETHYYPVRFDISTLSQGLEAPYRLCLQIAPIFRQVELDSTEQEFTLEVHSGSRLSIEEIPWNEIEIPPAHLFKGREEFIDRLVAHLKSPERNKTFILYGLTRTGKSSILRYLGRRIDLQPLNIDGDLYRFISFEWDIAKAKAHSNARDMWGYLLREAVVAKIEQMAEAGLVERTDIPRIPHPDNVRFRDWEPLLTHLKRQHLYPVFLLDEFSYYRELVDSKRIDASFLAAIRSFAINGQASFIFAGTYDMRKLIEDPSYGITGQFVNAIETRVSRIGRDPAIELIQVMEPRLHFTQDAIEHILRLSYQIPYFIQILCKNCAIYAVQSGRSIIGFPEVEAVTQTLTGENVPDPYLKGVSRIAPGAFMNNMYTPTDPVEFDALISTICDLTRNQLYPRMVTYPAIQEVWHRYGVRAFQARLAQAIQELTDREVLIAGEDEGIPAYRISVDLFRRWWANEHRHLELELDAIMA